MTRITNLLALPSKRLLVLLALVALVVAGCAGQGAPADTEEATPEPTAEPTPSPTEEPTDEASSDDGGSGTALADLIPDEVNGLERTDIPGMESMIAAALAGQGLDAGEAEFVFASYGSGDDAVIINAFRVPGMSQASLETLARAMSGVQSESEVSAETTTVAGKDVLRMTGPETPGAVYLYLAEGAAFTIVSQSEDLAEQLLSELP